MGHFYQFSPAACGGRSTIFTNFVAEFRLKIATFTTIFAALRAANARGFITILLRPYGRPSFTILLQISQTFTLPPPYGCMVVTP